MYVGIVDQSPVALLAFRRRVADIGSAVLSAPYPPALRLELPLAPVVCGAIDQEPDFRPKWAKKKRVSGRRGP